MNSISAKQKQIALTIGGTAVVAVTLWFSFVGPQWRAADLRAGELNSAKDSLESTKQKIRNSEKIRTDLGELSEELDIQREKLISGDHYLWVLRALNEFKDPDTLSFDFVDEPVATKWPYPSGVPLEGASFLIKGVSNYQKLGWFMAAFENKYPGLRFTNLDMTPHEPLDSEQIDFTLHLTGIVAREKGATKAPPIRTVANHTP